MLQIKDTIISLDVLEKKFACDLKVCKGACCVKGDSGAPISQQEIEALEKDLQSVKPFMTAEGVEVIDEKGVWGIDEENDVVTPLIDGAQCAFVFIENGINKCAIERAFFEGKSNFRKPISCFLYPVRLKDFDDFTAVNYDEWDICNAALKKGKKENIQLHEFLKEPLTENFGKEWFEELSIAFELYKNNNAENL